MPSVEKRHTSTRIALQKKADGAAVEVGDAVRQRHPPKHDHRQRGQTAACEQCEPDCMV